jgi:hypothetical protein
MKKSTKWIYMVVGSFLAIGLVAGAGFLYLRSEAAELGGSMFLAPHLSGLPIDLLDDGDRPMGKYEEALAEALGITVDELQAAHDAIFKDRIEAAVDEGKLTEEQAEQLLSREGPGYRGRRAPIGMGSEMNSLLADELGITASTLEAAQAKAHEALMAEALENGDLSEEQVEMMRSHQALAPYLQAAMAEAFENAVDQALSEGAITQTQAELLLENGRPGFRSGGMFPGGPGMRGRGGQFPGGRYLGTDES